MHVKPGKGAAFVRSKLKNCITGNMLDKTFRAGEPLTAATVEKRSCQFTYVDGEDVSLKTSAVHHGRFCHACVPHGGLKDDRV